MLNTSSKQAMQVLRNFRFHHCVTQRLPDGTLWSRRFRVGFDLQMALRYIHATDEVTRRAVENLVKSNGSSDESVTFENGRVSALS